MSAPNDPDRPGSHESIPSAQSYPAAPASNAGVQTIPVPREVTISFWIWIVTAVMIFSSVLSLFGQRDEIRAQTMQENQGNLTPEEVDQAVTLAFGLFFIVYLAVALLFTLFAFKAKAGRNWARIALAVVTGLNLVAFISGPNQGHVMSLVSILVSVAAVVLLYLPNSSAYFALKKGMTPPRGRVI
ncbi:MULTISPECIES: hypothetical protein [Actinoalloteichus]|uniref:Uncharacterized protein n=1 Tax=Actinoalloteichus fjordicus TaxID=1612552 RepID=A0AAC9L7X8_9PSEU|nr:MULTISPECIES: hypothetical protein [Actinoalloteichus]APU12556.1 hypothetical protein UA74_02345 [Actinoalloteichus fjordicus]APU18509.1 hypothetical protein UA75_02350 [Actinoalloteichus sp. GBA129-24]